MPSQRVTAPRAGSILRIEVDNFKSYKGKQIIGPFRNFTAVIGPNGAGKSNLMDAISFVLGVKSMHLRGSQLRDLIYSAEAERGRGTASVTLVYWDGEEELRFTRVITTAGASEYRINGAVVSYEAYNDRMKDIHLLVKARNFLVFQGDVESIASMSGKELTTLFETISGSVELKREYEELEATKNKLDEKMVLAYQKKRSLTAERKQVNEQKEEAEKHLALQKDLTAKKTEFRLWQLFRIDGEIKASSDTLARMREQLAAAIKEQEKANAEMKALRKEEAKLQKDQLAVNKKIAAKQAEADEQNPVLVKTKEQLQHVKNRLQDAKAALAEAKTAEAKHRATIAQLEDDLEGVQQASEAWEGEQKAERLRGGGIQVDAAQLDEYNKKKAEVNTKTAKLSSQLISAGRQLQEKRDGLSGLEAKVHEVDVRIQQIADEKEGVQRRVEQAEKSLAELREKLPELKRESKELAAKNAHMASRKEQIHAELQVVEERLREMRADKQEGDREVKVQEAIESLKRHYTGVYGRLLDLVKPQHRKYNLAVAVLLGRHMDSVVVDDGATAQECIRYLHDQRLGVMEFIPLRMVEAKPIQERLRALSGTAKLAIDVLQYDPAIERALAFACGNSLVCDTLEEAKRLAYGSNGERYKVVSLDGTLIAKSGSMTGGSSGSMEARSRRFDKKDIEDLKRRRDDMQRELASLRDDHEARVREEELQSAITGVSRRMQYAEADVKAHKDKLARLESSETELRAERGRSEPEMARLRAEVAAHETAVAAFTARIEAAADEVFRDWCTAIGVANVREYEDTQLPKAQQTAARRLEFSKQIAKLRSQIEYEKARDMQAPVRQLETKVAAFASDVKKLKAKLDAVEKAAEQIAAIVLGLDEERERIGAALNELREKRRSDGDDTKAAASRVAKLEKSVAAREHRLEQIRTRRSEVLEACEMEQIKLKLAKSSGSGGPAASRRRAALGGGSSSGSPEVPAGDSGGADSADRRADVEIDYSGLAGRLRKEMSSEDANKLDAELQQSIETLQSEVEKTAPNLKALDQYDATRERERATAEEFERTKAEAKEAGDRYAAVKAERLRRFSDAFEHIAGNIDGIYKELTRSGAHPMGGNAYLTLENPEDPYLHGIKFTAMPPQKRFRDMEQLSGGEKTVAALALLFAVHSYRPSPFFVLDEVDAALDNLNVAKVAEYIRSKSHADSGGFQSVVISLKDNFYGQADALVGVYRDWDDNCSKTLTFGLEEYGTL